MGILVSDKHTTSRPISLIKALVAAAQAKPRQFQDRTIIIRLGAWYSSPPQPFWHSVEDNILIWKL